MLRATEVRDAGRRLFFLDSLRGFAALYVVVFHSYLVPALQRPALPAWVSPLVDFGGSGVILFFVISAFSLSLTMPRHEAAGGLKSYYISRFFRIAPLFYVLMLFTYFWEVHYLGLLPKPVLQYVATALFAFNLVRGWDGSTVWAGWTVGTEMLFYVIFPVAYLYAKGIGRKLLVLAAAYLVFLGFHAVLDRSGLSDELLWEQKAHSIFQLLPTFIFGLLAFDTYMLLKDRPKQRLVGLWIFALGGLAMLWLIYHPFWPKLYDVRFLHALLWSCILLGSALARWHGPVARVAQFYGRISYSVYLWHAPVIFTSTPIFKALYEHLPALAALAAGCLFTLAVVTPLAYLTYRVIERPSEALGKKLTAFIHGPGPFAEVEKVPEPRS